MGYSMRTDRYRLIVWRDHRDPQSEPVFLELIQAAGLIRAVEAREANAAHGIEQVGEKLRAMMPWIQANKIVDKAKN